MKYKVQAYYNNKDFELEERWVEADSHLDACSIVMMDRPNVNWIGPIVVVDEDYNIGSFPPEFVDLNTDYLVGLRSL